MNVKYLPSLFGLFLFVLIALTACKNTPSSEEEQQAIGVFDAAYYERLGNNTRRLQMLKAGLFAQYVMQPDSSLKPWGEGGDSIYLYTLPVGQANKDGYWVLITQFLAGLPEEPLNVWFEKIERISRDTFGVWSYEWPVEQNLGYKTLQERRLDLEELGIELPDKLSGPPRSLYFRKNASHFIEVPQPRAVTERYAEQGVAYRRVVVDLQPIGSYFQPHYYDKDSVLMGSGATNALLRINEERRRQIHAFYNIKE